MIRIYEATTKDIKTIQNIAFETWPKVYQSIITPKQVEYMLDLFYSENKLLENVTIDNHKFLVIEEDNQPKGFAAIEHDYSQEKTTRLHKLYLLPESHGKGFGKLLLATVVEKSIQNSSEVISLNVNRFNPAIVFYKNAGFVIVGEEKLPIGQDFYMDDYKMELNIK